MSRQFIFLVGVMKNQITGSKLPSKRDILSVTIPMHLVKLTLHDSASLVFDECQIFWRKARIPIQGRSNCVTKIKKLYDERRKLDKNKNRNTDTQKKIMNTFKDNLNDLFDIVHSNALNIIKIHEDKLFLIKQREIERHGCMMGKDSKLTGLEFRKLSLEKQKARQNEKHKITSKSNGSLYNYIFKINVNL
jgi:adenylate/nucleoside-diphosphate kinase